MQLGAKPGAATEHRIHKYIDSSELTHVTPCPEEPFCAFKSLSTAREVKRAARKVPINPSTMLVARGAFGATVSVGTTWMVCVGTDTWRMGIAFS